MIVRPDCVLQCRHNTVSFVRSRSVCGVQSGHLWRVLFTDSSKHNQQTTSPSVSAAWLQGWQIQEHINS